MKKVTLYYFLPLLAVLLIVMLLIMYFRGNADLHEPTNSQQELKMVRDRLLADQETVRVNLLRSLDPQVKDTQGVILWNSAKQNGVLQMQGLPRHAEREKYQLWIYDLKRNNEQPILAANFYGSKSESAPYFVAIKPTESIVKAFKFVVTKSLINHNKFERATPLLFAQP